MPNKPHAPRASKGSKKPASTAAAANGEDTSFIVFSNSKDSKKGSSSSSTPAASTAQPTASSSKAKTGKPTPTPEPVDPNAPPKPTARQLIGGASWTGKLPVNMLSELCQKQKWEKPEYTQTRSSTPPGFLSAVILRHRNLKTQEMTTLPPMALPKERRDIGVQESAVEARHFAAAYALYRVANAKNLHMMMPPQYRDLWKGEFADMKKEAVEQGMGWLYEADPFKARKEWEDERLAKEKKRAEKEKRIEAEKKEASVGLGGAKPGKGWSRAPKIEMGKKMRRDVEALVRRGALWNPHGIVMSKPYKERVVRELSNLGFRTAHVEEATEICKDREEVLEWLLIHVPEDDLPKWSLPEGYTAGVSLASGDLAREGKLKRLATAGYALELCEEALDSCSGDEARAAERLQQRLLGTLQDTALSGTSTPAEIEQLPAQTESLAIGDDDVWNEEHIILASIFSDRYQKNKQACQIVLEVPGKPVNQIILHARRPSSGYPNTLPVLGIEAAFPAYIRLSILKQALVHVQADLLGEQMLFSVVDWLEQAIPNIIANPGKLSTIASVASTSAEMESARPSSVRSRRPKRTPRPINWQISSPISQRIAAEWQARQATALQQRMVQARRGLPAWRLQEDIVEAVTNAQVTIISGETGSGKSTQSVQFILDDMIKRNVGEAANIICTQPRRISALGLADRVADERCVKVGEEVGFAIRGESKQKAGVTKITFVTTGVLLRRLQTSGGRPQDVVDALADVSHVVIDEVHERSLDTDFLMVLLRDVLKVRKDLKLILMSATLDAAIFEKYFSATSTVSKIEIQGRTHPVQDIYLDDVLRLTGFGGNMADDDEADEGGREPSMGAALRTVGMRINYDLIAQTVEAIDAQLGSQDGGILIFLPGVAEIDRTIKALQVLSHIHALPLHASLQPADQKRVFPPAPPGRRKVIVATNVAETSITIEDIVAVIDTGRVKETSFDPSSNMTKLAEVWASRAACKQRRGRAGRVRAGTCYKLYTRNAEQQKMAERPDPEILRVPLEQLCLSVLAMGVSDVPAFLASALTPPSSVAVTGALRTLDRMGALDGPDTLTALGRHLAMIPADLRCGKLLVYGALFGCLEASLTISAILTARSPFVAPMSKRDEAKEKRAAFAPPGSGDLLCDLRAFETWSAMRASNEPSFLIRQWCQENFLSERTLFDIVTNRRQYLASLQEIGFIPFAYNSHNHNSSSSNAAAYNSSNDSNALLRALIAAAFSPQIARIEFPDTKYAASVSGAVALDPEARTIKYFREPPALSSLSSVSFSSSSNNNNNKSSNGGGSSNGGVTTTPTTTNERAFPHPSSPLFSSTTYPSGSAFLSYFSTLNTSKLFLHSLTPLNAYTLLLFGGGIELDVQGRGLLVDGWIKLKGWARIGVLVSRLRGLLDRELGAWIEEPGRVFGSGGGSGSGQGAGGIVGLVRMLVELDGVDR